MSNYTNVKRSIFTYYSCSRRYILLHTLYMRASTTRTRTHTRPLRSSNCTNVTNDGGSISNRAATSAAPAYGVERWRGGCVRGFGARWVVRSGGCGRCCCFTVRVCPCVCGCVHVSLIPPHAGACGRTRAHACAALGTLGAPRALCC